jgi:hypothetical protein
MLEIPLDTIIDTTFECVGYLGEYLPKLEIEGNIKKYGPFGNMQMRIKNEESSQSSRVSCLDFGDGVMIGDDYNSPDGIHLNNK